MKKHFVEVPSTGHYWILSARVPLTCLQGWQTGVAEQCLDSTVRVDLEVRDGRINAIDAAGKAPHRDSTPTVDLRGSMAFPTFVDLHTHIGGAPTHLQCTMYSLQLRTMQYAWQALAAVLPNRRGAIQMDGSSYIVLSLKQGLLWLVDKSRTQQGLRAMCRHAQHS